MVGQGSFPPVHDAFELARRLLPGLQRVGVAWNPAETNSRAFATKAREACRTLGPRRCSRPTSTTRRRHRGRQLADRPGRAGDLGGRRQHGHRRRSASVIATAADRAYPRVHHPARRARSRHAVRCRPRLLRGGRQGGCWRPTSSRAPTWRRFRFATCWTSCRRSVGQHDGAEGSAGAVAVCPTRSGPTRPRGLTTRAPHERAAGAPAADRAAAKTWRVDLIQFNQCSTSRKPRRASSTGCASRAWSKAATSYARSQRAGRHGHRERPDRRGGRRRADLLITFSTPTLQAALQRARHVPIVFNYVADPIAAGAGTSDTDHLPNVTGVYLIGGLRRHDGADPASTAEGARLGTVFVPAEVNMVFNRDCSKRRAAKAGLE